MPNDSTNALIVAAEDEFRSAIIEYHNIVMPPMPISMVNGFTVIYEYLAQDGTTGMLRFHDEDSTQANKFGRIWYADKLDQAWINRGVITQ